MTPTRLTTLFITSLYLFISACTTPVLEPINYNDPAIKTTSDVDLYIVPIGNKTPTYIEQLARDIAGQFDLKVKTTSRLAIKGHTYDKKRDQLIAQELIRLLENYASHETNDQTAIFVGITPFDIYDRSKKAAYVLYLNDKQRFAIVSNARISGNELGNSNYTSSKIKNSNLRKLMASNIGELLYKLPLKENPNSVLYKHIYTLNDLQLVTEQSMQTDIIDARNQKRVRSIDTDIADDIVKLKAAAETGDPLAQNNLAWAYQNGLGVTQDFQAAREWYLKAAQNNFTRAQNNLGHLYLEGLGVEQNNTEALKWFLLAAQAGMPTMYLAEMYFEGDGTEQNLKEAAHWYSVLAEKGDATSQYRLGNMYFQGMGVPKDAQKAVPLYNQAAEQGLDSAQFALGIAYMSGQGVEKDWVRASQWLEKAGQQGHRKAQFHLGKLYLPRDEYKAEKWLHQAANQNSLEAQFELGKLHLGTFSKVHDDKKALDWLTKSANSGFVSAQALLGNLYFNGTSVKKNVNQAFKYFQMAARQGDLNSKFSVGFMHKNGIGTIVDLKMALFWYRTAALSGHSLAQNNLGSRRWCGQRLQKGH